MFLPLLARGGRALWRFESLPGPSLSSEPMPQKTLQTKRITLVPLADDFEVMRYFAHVAFVTTTRSSGRSAADQGIGERIARCLESVPLDVLRRLL
jgi:hypothetical protein